jgi:hypothetical protein
VPLGVTGRVSGQPPREGELIEAAAAGGILAIEDLHRSHYDSLSIRARRPSDLQTNGRWFESITAH